ncbi:urea ABC transporter permease subunit UrtB [Allohahella marinimesophila]
MNKSGGRLHWLLALQAVILMLLASSPHVFADEALDQAVLKLQSPKLMEVRQALPLLKDSESEVADELLAALLTSDLYRSRADDRLVVMGATMPGGVEVRRLDMATEPPGLTEPEIAKKGDFRRVATNNAMRRQIRTLIATRSLQHKEVSRRLNAVNQIFDKLDEDNVELIQSAFAGEDNAEVKALMQQALQLFRLQTGALGDQLEAAQNLQDSLQPAVVNEFRSLRRELTDIADTRPLTAQEKLLQRAASDGIRKVEEKAEFYSKVENLFFGLSLGSVLVLAAIGLAVTFGVMGVINMAHGELIMLGAYTTFVIQQLMPQQVGLALLLSIPCAFVVSAVVGMLIERGVIRFLYGRPLETLLATFGVSLILQQAVRSIFSPLNRAVESPDWMHGVWQINPIFSITYNRLFIIFFSLMVFFALLLVLKKTSLGLRVRAVSQNRAMAQAMGVRSAWVDCTTFGLGSGIAGIAGVALSQLTNVGPNLGQSYIIDSFMVVVFGGVGNLWGTLVAGLSLGVANKFLEPFSGAVLAKILVLIFIILFIQKRPRGLFPQKGRAVDG